MTPQFRWFVLPWLAVAALVLAGCGGLPTTGGDSALKDALYTYAAVKLIRSADVDAERAAEVHRVAGEVLAVLEGDPEAPISVLEAQAREEIPWEELKPEDVALAELVIQRTREALLEVSQGQEARVVQLRAVLERLQTVAGYYTEESTDAE